MKRLIVHIGWEKTGTTSLQSFLSVNSQKLREFGICYPNNQNLTFAARNSHTPLVGAVMDKGKPSEYRDFIWPNKQLDPHIILEDFASYLKKDDPTIVVSAEHFSTRVNTESELGRFRNYIRNSGRNITIICYIRDPVSMARSSHFEYVKSGGREQLNWGSVSPGNERFNPLHQLRRWAKVFGSENLISREYQRAKLIGGNTISDFCYLLDIDPSEYDVPDRKNITISQDQIELIRRCNRFLPAINEDLASWRDSILTRELLRQAIPRRSIDYVYAAPPGVLDRFSEVCEEIEAEFLPAGLSEDWRSTEQLTENPPECNPPDFETFLDELSAEWLVCLARKSQELCQQRDRAISERDGAISERDRAISERDRAISERDRAISERDGAISERDGARRYPWKYFKYAAKQRVYKN
ncbi:MAG: hypothetical protein AAFY56_17095 [Pseudomonadota bacterium]